MKKIIGLIATSIMTMALTFSAAFAANVDSPIVSGLNEFAFDFYKRLHKENENDVISPYSLSYLLEVLANSAEGDTYKQLMQLLHLEEVDDIDSVNLALVQLNKNLHTIKSCHGWSYCQLGKWWGRGSDAPAFIMANAIWADDNFSYKPNFLANMAKRPELTFRQVDFKHAPDNARQIINRWVRKNTDKLIQDLIAEGTFTTSTRLVLTNALYFKGQWETQFKREETVTKPFRLAKGGDVLVPMMQLSHPFLYAENEMLQMLQLPYASSTLSMAILLPKPKHGLPEVKANLRMKTFLELLHESYKQDVIVSLPKFSLQSTFNHLGLALQALGLTDAFNEKANFSHMSKEALVLSDLIQKTVIQVDEEGTVAAAATASAMVGIAYMPPVTFDANHPFIFIIFDRPSKLILFIGQVANPQLRT